MVKRRYKIPSTSALVAFESAARHCNFSRAAEELNTSQSAVSRHIADLETRLHTRLFVRHKKRLSLTEEGERFYRAVLSSLENIDAAASAIANQPGHNQLTIACTHEISHLFLLPRFDGLQDAVGDQIRIRIMTYEYQVLDDALDPRIDLLFTYQPSKTEPENRAIMFREALTPICSPAFAEKHKDILESEVTEWGELPFLNLTKKNYGWATWDDWFERVGMPWTSPKFQGYDNYVYLLEGAAAGRGLALGWDHLIDRHLAAGTLQAVGGAFVEFDGGLYAQLTARGSSHPAGRKCLEFLRSARMEDAQ